MNIRTIQKIGIIVILFILVLPNISSQKQGSENNIFRYDHLMNYPIPKCNSKWFFHANINTTGFVKQADYNLHRNNVKIFYFNSSQSDFGNAFINGLMNMYSSDHVYSIFYMDFMEKQIGKELLKKKTFT